MRLDTHQAQVIAEIYNKMYKQLLACSYQLEKLTFKSISHIINMVDGRHPIGAADIFNPKSMQEK